MACIECMVPERESYAAEIPQVLCQYQRSRSRPHVHTDLQAAKALGSVASAKTLSLLIFCMIWPTSRD